MAQAGSLNLADNTDQRNTDDEQELQMGAQPPRKRGLLRKLSSALQRKPTTRYGSFDGHRDSLEIVRRQVKTDGTAYRPRVPHPILSDLDDNNVDNEESSKNNDVIAEVAFQHPTAAIVQTSAGESTKEKRREDIEEEKEEVRISDISSQEDAAAVSVHQRRRDDEGHQQKISADSNPTPLPPLLQNDKVGFALSA
uniref:Uncharacterized protein n=1 Tax=Minutocellus polymorphus TaxID=265543 RepID=A0A7S0FNA7_9STRA